MKITVIHGQNHRGSTRHAAGALLRSIGAETPRQDRRAEIKMITEGKRHDDDRP